MGLEKASGLTIGRGTPGHRNLITDVPGVTVGHATIRDGGSVNTGVTAVLPHGGNLFRDKVLAASAVINGFGKTIGLMQVEELGTIETPILLTNTLSVGTAATALVKYMLAQNEDIGRTTGTVNPLVCECNDGFLNDIRGLHVREEHIFQAIYAAEADFDEGAVGAGTGMCCLGFKGGIGSASRVVTLEGRSYVIGALVLSNFGGPGRLMIDGRQVGRELQARSAGERDKGSIIMLLATDIPLSERQLKRQRRYLHRLHHCQPGAPRQSPGFCGHADDVRRPYRSGSGSQRRGGGGGHRQLSLPRRNHNRSGRPDPAGPAGADGRRFMLSLWRIKRLRCAQILIDRTNITIFPVKL